MNYDVLVLGAGLSGGLPAATYLQKAGYNVGLLEQADECGQFFSSYRRHGVLFDHSPVNFSCMSPAVEDLELTKFGYETHPPERLFATRDGQGRTIAYYSNPERTATNLATYSESDARTFLELLRRLDDVSDELLQTAIFTPRPDLDRAYELAAGVLRMNASILKNRSGVDLLENRFDSEAVRLSLAALPSLQLFGDMASSRHGALTWLMTYLLRSCVSPSGNGALVDCLVDAFQQYGGDLRTETPVEAIGNGTVTAAGRQYEAPIIVSNLGPPLTHELMDRPMDRSWSTDKRTIMTADVVLDRPLRWERPELNRAPRVYLIWDDWSSYKDWLTSADLKTFYGHLELTQFNNIYGDNDRGQVGLRVRFGSGPWLDGAWGDRGKKLKSWLLNRLGSIDREIPDQIVRLILSTPRDHWRTNPAAVHGNPVGGDFVDGQWMGERFDYRGPREGMYLSNGVWPPALSWMAAGYNAASSVVQDEGDGFPSWWTAPLG